MPCQTLLSIYREQGLVISRPLRTLPDFTNGQKYVVHAISPKVFTGGFCYFWQHESNVSLKTKGVFLDIQI
jgi:hypothetical protein